MGNLIASALGTAVGNPWTFPFIWAWIYTVGYWILGGEANPYLPTEFSFDYIFDNPFQVLLPMTVGWLRRVAGGGDRGNNRPGKHHGWVQACLAPDDRVCRRFVLEAAHVPSGRN